MNSWWLPIRCEWECLIACEFFTRRTSKSLQQTITTVREQLSNTCCWASYVALLRTTIGLCGCCHFHGGKIKVKINLCVYTRNSSQSSCSFTECEFFTATFTHFGDRGTKTSRLVSLLRNFHETLFLPLSVRSFKLSCSRFSLNNFSAFRIGLAEMNHIKGQSRALFFLMRRASLELLRPPIFLFLVYVASRGRKTVVKRRLTRMYF